MQRLEGHAEGSTILTELSEEVSLMRYATLPPVPASNIRNRGGGMASLNGADWAVLMIGGGGSKPLMYQIAPDPIN